MNSSHHEQKDLQVLAEGRFLRLVKRDRWEFAERVHSRGAIAVVAVTNEGNFLLVEQPRAAFHNDPVIELPAGIVGDTPGQEDEALEVAAQRELLEETGYHAQHLERLAFGPTSPGLSGECLAIYRATGLKKVAAGGGDDSEQITVHEVPLAQVETWLQAQIQQGRHIDLKVYAGLYFAVTMTAGDETP